MLHQTKTRYATTSMLASKSCKLCLMHLVSGLIHLLCSIFDLMLGNSFTPWFKLIARDFLFGWWDELLARKGSDGKVSAQSLAGIVDGSKVVKMV